MPFIKYSTELYFILYNSLCMSMLTENAPKVAVLVLNYNGKHFLKVCLESLRKQTYKNYDVYVIDNGSTDGSVEYVKEHFSWVEVIDLKRNLGFAKGYNEAIKMVDADFVALLNNDTRADENWLNELVNELAGDKSIIAAGSKILLYDNPDLINHAGAKITPIGGAVDTGLYDLDRKKYNIKRLVGTVCGAAMLVRKNLFLKIGGFDEDFFAYFEESDFCWRAWLQGFKIAYVPDSVIHHVLAGSWSQGSSAIRIFLGERNRLLTILKNFEVRNVVKALIMSIGFDFVMFYVLLKLKNYQGVKAILKGNYWILRNFRKILNKRRCVQKNRKVSDVSLEKAGFLMTLKEGFLEFNRFHKTFVGKFA